jgi:hypothetical protein
VARRRGVRHREPSKWDLVRAAGVTDVASSRDTSFAERWKDVGLTVVLNALAREFVDASLVAAAARRPVRGDGQDRRARRRRVGGARRAYRAFDLVEAGPDRIRGDVRASCSRASRRRPAPRPTSVHPLGEVPAVFRTMAGGGHVGKLVFATGAGHVRPDGVVLVSGGTGALGLVTAGWLVERGGGPWRCCRGAARPASTTRPPSGSPSCGRPGCASSARPST